MWRNSRQFKNNPMPNSFSYCAAPQTDVQPTYSPSASVYINHNPPQGARTLTTIEKAPRDIMSPFLFLSLLQLSPPMLPVMHYLSRYHHKLRLRTIWALVMWFIWWGGVGIMRQMQWLEMVDGEKSCAITRFVKLANTATKIPKTPRDCSASWWTIVLRCIWAKKFIWVK